MVFELKRSASPSSDANRRTYPHEIQSRRFIRLAFVPRIDVGKVVGRSRGLAVLVPAAGTTVEPVVTEMPPRLSEDHESS
jgi:hypothetical protein